MYELLLHCGAVRCGAAVCYGGEVRRYGVAVQCGGAVRRCGEATVQQCGVV